MTAESDGVPRALVTEAPLSLDALLASVSHAGAGAVVTFAGTVRDTNDGRPVTKLEYEAYASMATAEIDANLPRNRGRSSRRARCRAPPHGCARGR